MHYPSSDALRRAFQRSYKPKPRGLLAALVPDPEPETRSCPHCNDTGHIIRYRMDGSVKSDTPCHCRENQSA